MARTGRLARKAGVNVGPVLIYIAAVAVVGAGLFAWDAAYRRRQEEARRPPPPEVLVKNLVENIIGRDTVKAVKVDGGAGTVEITFESATYPPAARASVPGEIVAQGLVAAGTRVAKGQAVASVKQADGRVVVTARAEQAGVVQQVLVRPGHKVEENNAVATVLPDDKTEARQNLETEGLLAFQAITSQMQQIKTVTAKIISGGTTLATVVGRRGQKGVQATFGPSVK